MKKAFVKILGLILIMSLLITAVPLSASGAFYIPPHENAGSVVYYTEDDMRTAVMSVDIDGVEYYDCSDGKEADVDTSYIYDVIAKSVPYSVPSGASGVVSILDEWANLACAIFENGGKYTCSHNYGDYYGENNDNDTDEQVEIATLLANNNAISGGERKKDNYGSTGLSVASSLDGVRQKMCDDIAYRINRKTCDGADILGQGDNCPDALPALADSTSRDVIYNIATSITREGSTAKYQYNSYGIAFYDFDLMVLADEDLEYVTGAEEYKDYENPIEAAANAGVEGFRYSVDTEQTDVGSCVNQSILGVNEEVTLSTSQSQSVSTSIQNSETYSYTQMVGGEVEFSLFGLSAKGSAQFTFNQAYESVHTNEATKTIDVSSSYSTQTYVPPQTVAYVKQDRGTSSVEVPYQTPVALTFKVAVFSMSGDVYADSALTLAFSTAGYEQSNFSTFFGGSTAETGFYAYDSLLNKIDNTDVSGWDATYGNNHFFHKNHDGHSDATDTGDMDLDWKDISNTYYANVAYDHNINTMATRVPMLSSGTIMKVQTESKNSEVYDPLPLYLPTLLRVVDNSKQNYRAFVGGRFYLNTVKIGCFNKNDVEYFPFKATDGHWEVCEGSEDIIEYEDSTFSVIAKNTGVGYLRWVLNDDIAYTAEYESGVVTANDLAPVTIGINVLDVVESKSYTVEGVDSFAGTVGDEPVNVNDLLWVVDENGEVTDDVIKWEATCDEGADGCFVLTDDNMISFSCDNTIKVRAVVNPESIAECTTDWVEVTPREEREVVSATVSEVAGNKITLLIKHLKTHTELQNAKFDIPSYVTFYDQYGDVWQGEAPEVELLIDNGDGAYVDSNQVLTLSKKGEFNVTVKSAGLAEPIIGTLKFVVDTDIQHQIGDADGDNYRTIKDVTAIQKYLALLIDADDIVLDNADVNGDGKIAITDATIIQKYIAELITD